MGRFQQMVGWKPTEHAGYVFYPGPQQAAQLLGQNQLFPQRGPLQSSNSPQVRAWSDHPSAMAEHPLILSSTIGFASGGFQGSRSQNEFKVKSMMQLVTSHLLRPMLPAIEQKTLPKSYCSARILLLSGEQEASTLIYSYSN